MPEMRFVDKTTDSAANPAAAKTRLWRWKCFQWERRSFLLSGLWMSQLAPPLPDNKITDNHSRDVSFHTTRRGEARRPPRVHEGALASCSNPRDAPLRPFICLSSPLHLLALCEVHALCVAGSCCHEGFLLGAENGHVHLLVLPAKSCHLCFTSAYILCSLEQRNVDPRTGVCSRELMPTRPTSMVMCF